MTMIEYHLTTPDGEIVLTGEEFDCLWTLAPPACFRKDPMKGHWEKEWPETRTNRERLFALGLIDCFGNVEPTGFAVIKTINDGYEHEREMAIVEHELEELDRLDAACRRRSHPNRYDG